MTLAWSFQTTSAEAKLRLRAMDLLRERKTVNVSVSVRSPIGAPHDRVVGNVLAKKRGEVRAVMGEFGLVPGLRAIRASLLSVRGANGDAEGGVGVTKGGSDVRGSQIGARDEPRTWVSAVQSQDWAGACTNAVTAWWPRVASPNAQHVT